MDVTLVVLAAGIGSRFGGLKQAQSITPSGLCLLDFSARDAVRAGFNKVVFIIRKDIEDDFKQLVGNRIASFVDVQYVMQSSDCMPQGRAKPFGTAHALLCCNGVVTTPFAVINADDYYGAHAFDSIYTHLTRAQAGQYAMVAYRLGNTLSAHGGVTRGICSIKDNKLYDIVETRRIYSNCRSYETNECFARDTAVSMNLWGFTCDVFTHLENGFMEFLRKADLSKDEFLLPEVVRGAIKQGVAEVTVYRNGDKWYGVTYREDLAEVQHAMQQLIRQGLYKDIHN